MAVGSDHGFRGIVSNDGTHDHTHQLWQWGQTKPRLRPTNHAMYNWTDLRERSEIIAVFQLSVWQKQRPIWLGFDTYIPLNMESNRANGRMDCKVLTDLVKIDVKVPMHMFFSHICMPAVVGGIMCGPLKGPLNIKG